MFANDIVFLYTKGYSIDYIILYVYHLYSVFTKDKITLIHARALVEKTILEYLKK